MKTMKEQLVMWCKANNIPPARPKAKRTSNAKLQCTVTRQKQLTEQDLRYLMNSNMKTLKRGKGGAFR